MSNLPKEWEAIRLSCVQQALDDGGTPGLVIDGIGHAVERCYALHCKPPRELTDAEIEAISDKVEFAKFADDLAFARACIAAHQRKQQEPETVKFRAARFKDTCNVIMERADWKLSEGKEWLPGEPQEIEVTLP